MTSKVEFTIKRIALKDLSVIMTKANLKSYKKAKKELKNGQSLSLEEIKKRYGL